MHKILLFIIIYSVIACQGAMAEIVGALMPTKNIPHYMAIHDTFIKELQLLNYGAEVLLQKPAPTLISWKNATRKLVTLESKVIVAYGTATALAITGENPNVSVVYCSAYDPIGAGVSGKVTGMGGTVPFKGLLGSLKKISNFKKLAILYSPTEIDSKMQMEVVAALAGQLTGEVVTIAGHDLETLENNLQGVEALFLTSAAEINSEKKLKEIIEIARLKKIASAAVLSGTCELGVIISLSASPRHQGEGVAHMVAAILKGKNPKDTAANNSPMVELAINLKEATALGFTIPFELLGTANVKLIK